MVHNGLSHGYENRRTMRNRNVAEHREERSRRIFQNVQTDTESSIPLILLLIDIQILAEQRKHHSRMRVSTQSDERKKGPAAKCTWLGDPSTRNHNYLHDFRLSNSYDRHYACIDAEKGSAIIDETKRPKQNMK